MVDEHAVTTYSATKEQCEAVYNTARALTDDPRLLMSILVNVTAYTIVNCAADVRIALEDACSCLQRCVDSYKN